MNNPSNIPNPVQQTPVRKTESFVGILKREYERLKFLQPSTFKIYVGLRWLANFRTGRIGDDPKHPVNDAVLCDFLGQSVQAISTALGELNQVGLITDFSNTNGSMKMLLPLATDSSIRAPIGTSNIQLPPLVGNPQESGDIGLTSTFAHGNEYCSTSSNQNSTILSSTHRIQNNKLSPTLSIQPTTERTLPFDKVPENTQQNQNKPSTHDSAEKNISPNDPIDFDDWIEETPSPAEAKQKSLEEKLQTDQYLTVQELKDYLFSLNFLYVSGSISEKLYPRIVSSYPAREIKSAAIEVVGNAAVEPAPLRLSEALAKNRQAMRSNRGRVAL